jgi:predicted enzyme related to lactoylglutathione lyase
MKRFNSVCIVTPDVPQLRAFYASVLQTEAQGDDNFVEFARDGLALTLYSHAGMEGMAPGSTQGAGFGGVVLEFEVGDVDAEYQRLLRLGVPVVKPPTTQPWGLRSAWFRDPAGNILNLFAPASSPG